MLRVAMNDFRVSECFQSRPMRFLGVCEVGGWRLKTYSITYGDRALDEPSFEQGLRTASPSLPQPPIAPGRPGVGFVIFHQGRTGDYVVLCWWDNENELPIRVFVRRNGHDARRRASSDRRLPARDDAWRRAEGGESVCVWDLQIIAAERDAYVTHVLSPAGPDIDAYLRATL
jgi:hypothetical protein